MYAYVCVYFTRTDVYFQLPRRTCTSESLSLAALCLLMVYTAVIILLSFFQGFSDHCSKLLHVLYVILFRKYHTGGRWVLQVMFKELDVVIFICIYVLIILEIKCNIKINEKLSCSEVQGEVEKWAIILSIHLSSKK